MKKKKNNEALSLNLAPTIEQTKRLKRMGLDITPENSDYIYSTIPLESNPPHLTINFAKSIIFSGDIPTFSFGQLLFHLSQRLKMMQRRLLFSFDEQSFQIRKLHATIVDSQNKIEAEFNDEQYECLISVFDYILELEAKLFGNLQKFYRKECEQKQND